MDSVQNFTNTSNETEVKGNGVKDKRLTAQQELWIDYKACDGLFIDDEGAKKITIGQFAEKLGVSRQTLYDWQNNIPDFWTLVHNRRNEIGSHERLTKIHSQWYHKALEFKNWHVTEAWLRNFDPVYRESRVKVDHDISDNVGDLLNVIRQRREQRPVMDGEVVDVKQNDKLVYIEAEHVKDNDETLHTEQPMQTNEPKVTQASEPPLPTPTHFDPPTNDSWT